MAVIGVTLDEVLRDFVGQLSYTYTKYIDPEFKIKENEVTSSDLIEHFPFKEKVDFNKFLYDEAALEIFGHADQMHDNIFMHFNKFLLDIMDEEEHEVVILSKEANKSIPSTYFFLSKVLCKVKNVRFSMNYEDMWGNIDVMITATPELLSKKPDGKTTIKIKSSYNGNNDSDYEFNKLTDFIKDEELVAEIMNKIK